MAITNIEVTKNNNENSTSMIRRFTRRAQEMQLIQTVKAKRYAVRELSKLAQKTGALKRIEKRASMEKLRKLGKIA